ncbi:MAG: hypothetical protein WAT23_12685 [Chromatiaceae bacterium]
MRRLLNILLTIGAVLSVVASADMTPNPGDAGMTPAEAADIPPCPTGNPEPAIISNDTRPCDRPELWPCSVGSQRHPFLVHYRSTGEEEMANKVVGYLDTAWDFETKTLGFREPVPDEGKCGPDERFDIFLWKGRSSCAVDAIDPKDEGGVSCHPTMTYMFVDPWGKYGGDVLRQTMGHEFNHASQGVLDWNETLIALEMTATYVEQYFWDAYPRSIRDFQLNPERSLLWVNPDERDPDSQTFWYMYGSALYMRFLRDRYFPDDQRFAARLWEMLPNADCSRNSPNIVDGLNRLLRGAKPHSSFVQSAIEFARWRYFTGSRDDGLHFRTWPMPFAQFHSIPEAEVRLDGTASVGPDETVRYRVGRAPMILGSSYIHVVPKDAGQRAFDVAITPVRDPSRQPSRKCSTQGLKWVVQAVPGMGNGDDGKTLNLSRGPARVVFAPRVDGPSRTLIVSLIPTGRFDPDDQCEETFPFELQLRSLK